MAVMSRGPKKAIAFLSPLKCFPAPSFPDMGDFKKTRKSGKGLDSYHSENSFVWMPKDEVYQMQTDFHLVALYANILAYGTENVLAEIAGTGMETKVRGLALGGPPGRENLSLPECSRG